MCFDESGTGAHAIPLLWFLPGDKRMQGAQRGGSLESRLIDRQSQNKTVAATATAERKVFAHLS